VKASIAVDGTYFFEETANFYDEGCGGDSGGFSSNREWERCWFVDPPCFFFNSCWECDGLATGMTEELVPHDISIFPNPAGDYIHLVYEAKVADNMMVTLLDNTGRILRTFKWNMAAGNNRKTLQLSDLPAGAYTLRFANEKSSMTKMIIVE